MGVIVRPDDLQSIMAEVYARLEAIERTSGPMHDFAIRDPNGILRVAGGNLPALGISPAQEGIRVVDQYGNPIFDTLGLSQVMSQPGSAAHVVNTGSGPSTTSVPQGAGGSAQVNGMSVAFTLNRPTAVLAVGALSALATAATYSFAEVGIGFTSSGYDSDSSLSVFETTAIAYGSAPFFLAKTLAAGAWTARLLTTIPWYYPAYPATTLNVFNGSLYVFQLGS